MLRILQPIVNKIREWRAARELNKVANNKNLMKMLELAVAAEMLKRKINKKPLQFPIILPIKFIVIEGVQFYIFVNDEPYCSYPLRVKIGKFPVSDGEQAVVCHAYLIAVLGGANSDVS